MGSIADDQVLFTSLALIKKASFASLVIIVKHTTFSRWDPMTI